MSSLVVACRRARASAPPSARARHLAARRECMLSSAYRPAAVAPMSRAATAAQRANETKSAQTLDVSGTFGRASAHRSPHRSPKRRSPQA
ncbi:hypothetical protein E2R23_09600 [Burkholderia pseudomallei]|nr:hypothetical protein EXY28_09535 [Burkholderia pseudomallei]QBL78006.1 hypothetical protein EYA82_09500 [Burkholderia pseudomallei]QBP48497.1 hypothetical protein E2R28_09515 [Burkholderia pseudomallei]QBP55146.1 hypothetical protein E2R23_09600 [Burkholderia pseudomallei]QBP61756.1 hypothetical protein E2R29_09430 [Burkholderia pseudomallei]